ncbi:hypothetical protein AKG37_09550 [Bacillus australimaris]|uniref:Uncharacterized protein n=1 Tax=Bacillus australimaris TaxID=1326968 RepID=A0ABR5MRC2_9BACI|nr:hypothetical protein AKG37_09550 [Bacillus australimaris]
MTIITMRIHVKKKSFIIKKMIGLRVIFGILPEATIPIIVLKVSAADVKSVVEEDIAFHIKA